MYVSGGKISSLLLLALIVTCLSVNAQEQTVGLFVNEPESSEGYTLYGPMQANITYLIDNGGRVVHSWTSAYRPGLIGGYLKENGNLLRAAQLPTVDPVFLAGLGRGGRIEEFDWDGNLLWEFEYSSNLYLGHHDIEPLPNGNVLLVAWEYKTNMEARAAGRDPALLSTGLWPLHIIEIEPTPPSGGNIVWEWHVWDHLIQDYSALAMNYGVVEDHPELMDVNWALTENPDWVHANTVAYNAALDQIVITSRNLSEFWVIDHSTTTEEAAGHTGGNSGMGGDILYRWGNPLVYRRGTAGDQMEFGPHDTHWIAPGLPGEGNFIIYNNGAERPVLEHSQVDEIASPVDEWGQYPIESGMPFEPADPAWSFVEDPPEDFFSELISGAQRQSNGNTLICEGNTGRLFEVTSEGDIVWEYVNPINGTGAIVQGSIPTSNSVFKVRRYAPDYPGLAGRDLTPGDPLEGGINDPYPPADGSVRASRLSAGGDQVEVVWDAVTCPTADYNLLFGNLSDLVTLDLLGAECGIGITGSFLWTAVPAGDLFFLVAGTDDSSIYESSWGQDSSGNQRGLSRASFLCGTTTKIVTSTCP